MFRTRRLKRNVKRLLIPFETALLWTVGPLATLVYWALHGITYALPLGRGVSFLLTRLR